MAEKKKSLADQAYEIIKNNIMNLTYPPGMPLTEALLTEELGMSRNPVRTALKMLQSEGLIVTDYYKSMTVKEITDKDINELYQLRELLEGSAFKLIFEDGKAVEQGTHDELVAREGRYSHMWDTYIREMVGKE